MPTDLTLYQAEDDLAALVDTAEMVPAEQIEAFEQALVAANAAAIEKRAACIRFLRHLENQVDLCKAERERIKAREDSIARNLERMEQYIVAVMEKYVPAPKTGPRKLSAGGVGELALVKKPDSVVVNDIAAVPNHLKSVEVKLPVSVWLRILRILNATDGEEIVQLHDAIRSSDLVPNRSAIKKAFDAKEDVPGADMTCNQYRLEIR